MKSKEFRKKLLIKLEGNRNIIEDENKTWSIKGFIDNNGNLFTISTDTKVLSKILEIQLFPLLVEFASENNMILELSEYQNHYPDCTFISESGDRFALDLKSTYTKNINTCNGFTLGAYSGYFRNRNSTKNILYPYNTYKKHFVLGIIYDRYSVDERKVNKIEDIKDVESTIGNFRFLVQEKYRLARMSAGSGNTKNIGSLTKIKDLIKGNSEFHSEEEFDNYWMNY